EAGAPFFRIHTLRFGPPSSRWLAGRNGGRPRRMPSLRSRLVFCSEVCLAGGEYRRAAFGTVNALVACCTMISAVAVIPGRNKNSELSVERTALYVTTPCTTSEP